jgi:ATP-binding cassette, subfamily A (ABC1), member 3
VDERPTKPQQRGIGSPLAVRNFKDQFGDGSLPLIWADGTNGTDSPTPQEIMDRVTSQLAPQQRPAVRRVSSPDDIRDACPIELHQRQSCFLAVSFDAVSAKGSSFVNYTIYSKQNHQVDVKNHDTFEEQTLLPLQWAIDQVRRLMSRRTHQLY